jgi:thioredoxin-like negative regulator of GroEL
MPVTNLDSKTFRPTVSSRGIVLVSCHAPWCPTCGDFRPVFEAASARHPGHTFAALDTRAEPEIAGELGVKSVPTLMLFRDGLLLFVQSGTFDADALDDIVRQAESLDMSLVRAEIEAEIAGAA